MAMLTGRWSHCRVHGDTVSMATPCPWRHRVHGDTVDCGTVCDQPHSGKLLLLVACFTSQQHASLSQGRICSDNCTCCHTETEVTNQTFHLTQSQYTNTRPTSRSTDPMTPGAWQSSQRSPSVWYEWAWENLHTHSGNRTQVCRSGDGRLSTT